VGVFSGGGGLTVIPVDDYSALTTMELESDTYDVVVIGTGLAQSIAAA
jgi:hypothetical protein